MDLKILNVQNLISLFTAEHYPDSDAFCTGTSPQKLHSNTGFNTSVKIPDFDAEKRAK